MIDFLIIQIDFVQNFFVNFLTNPWEIVWIFALIFMFLSFSVTNDKKMFILLAICSWFYSIHFFWLWLITAWYINLLDIIKNLSVIRFKKNISIFTWFSVIYLIVWWLTANWDILSFLLTIATIVSMYAAFFFRWITLRLVYLWVIFIYMTYTVVWNSISWSISNLVMIISICLSIYLIYKRRWFWWKVRYYRFLISKNIRKFIGFRYRRVKFIR